jgi:calcineurin-like phosphoesterase family protein
MELKLDSFIIDITKLSPECIQEMQHIWFIADLHAQHPKIVDICNRPTTWEDHDEWLLKEVYNNHIIQKRDEVYILGDVSLGKRKDAEKWIARLKGNKHLIAGNHDKNILHLGNWEEVTQIKDFTFSRYGLNIHIVLAHYPIASWNRKIHGSWHLYGHVHGRFQNTGLSWDVGIDNQNFYVDNKGDKCLSWLKPVNLFDVVQIMNYRYNVQIMDGAECEDEEINIKNYEQ